MKTKLTKILLSASLLLFSGLIYAKAPSNYYTGVDGKNKGALKTALYQAIKSPSVVSYDGLWEAFKKTDKKTNGKVWDMYSDNPNGTPPYEFTFGSNQCGNYKNEGDCYNREHSFPKSWFNDAKPMYSDLFHLYPTDGKVNGMRSNWAFGNVGVYDWKSENGSMRGQSAMSGYSGTVFEPIDEYKGDFARTYFYMVTCYEDKIGGWNSPHLSGSKYPAFNNWSVKLLLEWSRMDPVSQKEIARNDAVYGVQKNRNPFIDFPGLEEYIWGDKMDQSFDSSNPGGTTDPSLSVTSPTLSFSVNEINNETSKIINIKGFNLTGDLSVNIAGDNVFTSQTSTITKSQAENGYDLQVNYLPLVYGASSAVLSINGGGLSKSTEISLSGIASELPSTGGNLLLNGEFESWTSGNPDSWTLTSITGASFAQESSIASSGSYSLKITNAAASGNARISQKVVIEPQKTYRYSFKYYVDPTSTNDSGLRYWGFWNDASGGGSFNNSDLQMSTEYLDTSVKGKWISFEKDVTSPVGSGMVQPEIRVYKGMVIYIDDVVFADVASLGIDDNDINSIEPIVYISSGLINVIVDNPSSEIIEVYNIQGQLLTKEVALHGLNQIPVKSGQLLIVRIGNKTSKVITY